MQEHGPEEVRDLEIKQLEAFVAAAETRSFSEAARRLYLTQPTISVHIKALEQELECSLFLRSKRVVSLTEAGNLLYPYAQRILELRETALLKIRKHECQTISLGASTIPSGYLLPAVLTEFRKQYPDVFFSIRQSDSDQVENMVLDGIVDLGLIGKKSKDPRCLCFPFYSDTLVLALPAAPYYLKKLNRTDPLLFLAEEPVILREEGSGTLKAMNRFLSENHLDPENMHVIARSNDLEAIKKMIADGLGISVLSSLCVKDMASSGQILTLPLPTAFPRSFYLLKAIDQNPSTAQKDFENFLMSVNDRKDG